MRIIKSGALATAVQLGPAAGKRRSARMSSRHPAQCSVLDIARITEGGLNLRYLTIESIYLCQVRCPECGRRSYILNWQPEKCPHCRTDLRGYTEYELAASDRLLTLEIDRITGQVCAALQGR